MSDEVNYRESHSAVGYGERYMRTYAKGYFYEQWIRLERPLLRSIFDEVENSGVKKVLDFACGTGRILSIAEEFFPVTVGVDVSRDMLRHAESVCSNSSLVCQDITVEPLDAKFDLVTSFRFFVNAEDKLRNQALEAISIALKPQGKFIANIYVNSSSPLGLFYRARNLLTTTTRTRTLSHSDFKDLLSQYGFQIEKTFWYSYLPRTGWYLGWLAALMIEPVEKLGCMPIIPNRLAQSFLVVCSKNN